MPRIFADWQGEYAARGLPTFPIDSIADDGKRKLPHIRSYAKVGINGSQQLALKFLETNGLACMAGRRNRLTLLDVDARGAEADRWMAEVQRIYGKPRIIVRTGRDGLHGYYEHNGEPRKIRPDASCPIDILGGGVVVLPPSLGAKRQYEIIEGHIDDLTALTTIKYAPLSTPSAPTSTEPLRHVQNGERDKNFWPHVARMAHRARSLDDLIEMATQASELMPMPLTQTEIAAKCKYWWEKTESGQNHFGTGGFVTIDHAEIDGLMRADPDGYLLLSLLRRHHWGRDFPLANATCELMPDGGWRRKRFAAARDRLIEGGYLSVVKPAYQRRPMICRHRERGRAQRQGARGEGCISSYWWSNLTTLNVAERKLGAQATAPTVLTLPHLIRPGFGLAFDATSPPAWALRLRELEAAVAAGEVPPGAHPDVAH